MTSAAQRIFSDHGGDCNLRNRTVRPQYVSPAIILQSHSSLPKLTSESSQTRLSSWLWTPPPWNEGAAAVYSTGRAAAPRPPPSAPGTPLGLHGATAQARLATVRRVSSSSANVRATAQARFVHHNTPTNAPSGGSAVATSPSVALPCPPMPGRFCRT